MHRGPQRCLPSSQSGIACRRPSHAGSRRLGNACHAGGSCSCSTSRWLNDGTSPLGKHKRIPASVQASSTASSSSNPPPATRHTRWQHAGCCGHMPLCGFSHFRGPRWRPAHGRTASTLRRINTAPSDSLQTIQWRNPVILYRRAAAWEGLCRNKGKGAGGRETPGAPSGPHGGTHPCRHCSACAAAAAQQPHHTHMLPL